MNILSLQPSILRIPSFFSNFYLLRESFQDSLKGSNERNSHYFIKKSKKYLLTKKKEILLGFKFRR